MVALSRRSDFLTEITTRNLHIAILRQLPTAQLALGDQLESRALAVERPHAPLRRRALIQEVLEDPPTDPGGALTRTENCAEFHGIAVVVPSSIVGKLEKQHCDLQGSK